MDFQALTKDRFLRKDPNQSDRTKDAAYTAQNPAPKRGNDRFRKEGRPEGAEQDDGAPNILTGTVIISCFIQTSALPSRIEMQGNDLTFFDDTFTQNGQVIGDTSRLIFTHGSGKKGDVITAGFILEKRASQFNTYDNVLSLYSPAPPTGAHNYIFIGRSGSSNPPSPYLTSIHFAVNSDSQAVPVPGNAPYNGIYEIEYWKDTVWNGRRLFIGGKSEQIFGNGVTGFSSIIFGGDEGVSGIAYKENDIGGFSMMFYVVDNATIVYHGDLIPDLDNALDIGTPGNTVRNIYLSGALIGGTIQLPGGITWSKGVGSPEGVVTAPIGSLYSNTSGGASTTLYVKTSGASNTGWTAK